LLLIVKIIEFNLIIKFKTIELDSYGMYHGPEAHALVERWI